MPRSSRSFLRPHTPVLLLATAALALSTAAVPSQSIAADTAPTCPAAVPVSELEKRLDEKVEVPVHGLTVSAGTTPDEFTGEVVGVIDDGIAVGLDMIMVKLSGSVITMPGDPTEVDRGIWAGMSGSPVYAADGRLIGAVSYGLSWSPSEYAGVTPAAAMYGLGRYDKVAMPSSATDVDTTARAVAQLTHAGLPAKPAQAGFERLPMPTNVSGLRGARLDRVADRMRLAGLPLAAGGLATGGTAMAGEATDAIVPGGNVAMAMSYGDVTAAGVGTTTAVCGSSVLAFGHPFAFGGRATASMHGAEAVYVQRDSIFGSFKVANPTAPVGVFTQDRLPGILGRLGTLPATTPVTSTVASTEGNTRTGSTHVVDPSWTSMLATIHLLSNLDSVFDGYQGGTGTLRWTITVRRPDGRVSTLDRTDVYSDPRDLTFSLPWDFFGQLNAIVENRFTKVDVVRVRQQASLEPVFRQHRVGAVQVRRRGRWVTPGRRSVVPVRAGRPLRLRAWLEPAQDSPVARRAAYLRVRVPRSARGRVAVVSVQGAMSMWGRQAPATSFDAMLAGMDRAPDNTTVVAQLRARTRTGVRRVERRFDGPAPVVGSRYFRVAAR